MAWGGKSPLPAMSPRRIPRVWRSWVDQRKEYPNYWGDYASAIPLAHAYPTSVMGRQIASTCYVIFLGCGGPGWTKGKNIDSNDWGDYTSAIPLAHASLSPNCCRKARVVETMDSSSPPNTYRTNTTCSKVSNVLQDTRKCKGSRT